MTMMKTIVLGIFGVTAMVACTSSSDGGGDSTSTPPTQAPAGGTTTSAPSPTPAPSPVATTSPPSKTVTPAEPTPAATDPTTCAELATTTTPAATFAIDEAKSTDFTAPVDVYVTESTTDVSPPNQATQHWSTIEIALTNTPHVCGLRDNALIKQDMNELRIAFTRSSTTAVPAPITPGTYESDANGDDKLAYVSESGQACMTPPPPGATEAGFTGTAESGGLATGSVTITNRTATTLTGTIDVVIETKHLVMSFSAPICKLLAAPQKSVCCVEK